MISNILPSSTLLELAVVAISDREDSLSWSRCRDGNFSVRSGYGALENLNGLRHEDRPFFGAIWKLKTNERVRAFLWLASKGGVLTNAERMRRHLGNNDLCPICHITCESAVHLFRDCDPVRKFWLQVEDTRRMPDFFSVPFAAWLRTNVLSTAVGRGGEDWNAFFAVALWWLWRRRNEAVFDNGLRGPPLTPEMCWSLVSEYKKSFRDGGLLTTKKEILTNIGWVPPCPSWMKINTDGAVKRFGCAAAGGVIRDEQGNWIVGFTMNIGACSVVAVELWAIVKGLEATWDLGLRKVECETDSEDALRLLKGPVKPVQPGEDLLILSGIYLTK